jgi:pyridoxamine 5'-phosphate oxidase
MVSVVTMADCATLARVHDLATERVDYTAPHLLETDVPAAPVPLFEAWLAEAMLARDQGRLAEPNAMVVATSVADRPHARTVLLKSVSAEGFVFFTNYTSHKGTEIAANAAVALHFGWYALQRQVRVEGTAVPVSRAESADYFRTRPRGSQLGAWASAQSSAVGSAAELADAYAAAERRFAGQDVPCSDFWGGFRVAPESVEFWQGRPSRMHDRLLYTRDGSGWRLTRLSP